MALQSMPSSSLSAALGALRKTVTVSGSAPLYEEQISTVSKMVAVLRLGVDYDPASKIFTICESAQVALDEIAIKLEALYVSRRLRYVATFLPQTDAQGNKLFKLTAIVYPFSKRKDMARVIEEQGEAHGVKVCYDKRSECFTILDSASLSEAEIALIFGKQKYDWEIVILKEPDSRNNKMFRLFEGAIRRDFKGKWTGEQAYYVIDNMRERAKLYSATIIYNGDSKWFTMTCQNSLSSRDICQILREPSPFLRLFVPKNIKESPSRTTIMFQLDEVMPSSLTKVIERS